MEGVKQTKLYEHQKEALKAVENDKRCAFFHPMGSGKTFTGTEKMIQCNTMVNLVICQKSKVNDWVDHLKIRLHKKAHVIDLTRKPLYVAFWEYQKIPNPLPVVGVINYDLVFRRSELADLRGFTLLLDESSLIQNESAKRSDFILKMHPKNVILLSGTPVGGKYENLWTQLRLLGWNISKQMFYQNYIDFHYENINGFPHMIIDGYKNVDRMKSKMRKHGAHFLTQDDLFDLPEQIHQTIRIDETPEFRIFKKNSIVTAEDIELIGDCALTKLLYQRMLCGQYNTNKLQAFEDLLNSTDERFIVFYNFNEELKRMVEIVRNTNRDVSLVNGNEKDLSAYEADEHSITFIQYQAGAMGLNLQKANRIIYFTPPLSSELFEQSKKRIHRIGQERTCFYYYLTCGIETKIYKTLAMRRDYTEYLFKESET